VARFVTKDIWGGNQINNQLTDSDDFQLWKAFWNSIEVAWEGLPHSNVGETSTENMGFRCHYYKWITLGSGHTARQTLRLAGEEMSLWSPSAGPRPSSVVVAKDQVMPTKCEGILMARSESPLQVESSLVEQRLEAHPHAGIYIART
jgi:hypothetical protein